MNIIKIAESFIQLQHIGHREKKTKLYLSTHLLHEQDLEPRERLCPSGER